MDSLGSKVFVSDRWVKKNVLKKIKELGGKFIVIDILNLPMDNDGKMDKEAVVKAYKQNLDNIVEGLK